MAITVDGAETQTKVEDLNCNDHYHGDFSLTKDKDGTNIVHVIGNVLNYWYNKCIYGVKSMSGSNNNCRCSYFILRDEY